MVLQYICILESFGNLINFQISGHTPDRLNHELLVCKPGISIFGAFQLIPVCGQVWEPLVCRVLRMIGQWEWGLKKGKE